jgi:hypothetical protein
MKTFIAIAAVLTAAALMAIVSTTPLAALAERDYDMKDDDGYGKDHDRKDYKDNDDKYGKDHDRKDYKDRDGKDRKEFYPGDTSETNTEQNLKQKNVGSGSSTNINCGTNNIDTTVLTTTICPTVSLLD